MDLMTAAADLFLGARCAGCGAPARSLCRECAIALRPRPAIVRARPCDVAAAGEYDAELRRAIIAWKEHGRLALERPLAHLLAASVLTLDIPEPIRLVPVPTRPDQRRARGADVVRDLARVSARLLNSVGVDASVSPAMRVTRRVRDQAGLTAAERRSNLSGSFAVARVPLGPVVIVDDVVTTGATLVEAMRVLPDVAGAAVIAHRPRPSR
jgi:ComF family protein